MKIITLLFITAMLALTGCDKLKETIGIAEKESTNSASAVIAAPTGFTVQTVSNTSIQISWSNHDSTALLNTVEMCSGAACVNFVEVSRSPYGPQATTHTESGLTANTVYRFRIRVTSPSGNSEYLTSSDVLTQLVPNTSLSLVSATAHAISISWVVNDSNATGLQIQRCNGTGCTAFANTFSSPLTVGTTTYTESGLSEASIYRFRVRAITSSSESSWVTTSDLSTLPAEPSTLAGVATSSTAISLSWLDNSNVETGYDVQKCVGSACTSFAAVSASPLAASAVAHIETGLIGGTTYRFRVRATNSTASSNWLTTSDITTYPAAPTALAESTITDSSMNLTWTDNAANELIYELQSCTGSACTSFTSVSGSPLAPNTTSFVAVGLSASTLYSFRLRTVSVDGVSAWLTLADVQTAPAVPTGFTNGTISSSSIQFSWTDVATDETSYQVQRCAGSACTSFADVTASPLAAASVAHTESGLSSSSVYRFRVRAVRGSVQSTWLTSADITTSTGSVAASTCSSPQTRVIDSGLKGNVAGVGRGLWSDTKIIPGTQSPATAYYDGSATGGTASIKMSYWDGIKFNVENVAADAFVAAGSATWVKLAFLTVGANAGRPIVVWTTGGTTVKAAMRSAAFTSTGTWSAAVIDTVTGALNRTASISVSPADHVSVAYLTNTSTAGRVRFIYCDAPCTSLSSFVTMTAPADTVENTTQVAGLLGIDTAWCKFDSTTYYPAVVYHGNTSANVRYAVCANSNLTSCKTAAGWTASSIVANAAPVHMQMYTNSSSVQDTVKVLVKPAAGTALTTYTSATGCNAPGAFTAGTNVVGATTAGTAWAKLLKDAGGLFHVVANDAATSVVYMNSNSANFQSTTWNAAGTVETVTLPAVGAGAGGADIANSYGMIYSSYGLNANPFNLNMGIVNDITIPSNNAAAVFYTVLPDTTGSINMPLAAGNKVRNVSVANTSDGRPGVAYVDFSAGALTGGRLKYAVRSGTTASSSWSISLVPNVTNPLFPSLAYDHSGLPWISFYDSNNFRYYLATNSSNDGSGTWTVYQAPIGAKIASGVAPATDDTALAMYYSGGVAQPVLIFINSTAAGGTGVRAIRLNPTTGQFGNLVTIDALGASFATRLSADFDVNGNMVVAYYDITTTTVKFNFSTNGGATWKPASTQLTAAGVGREGLSLKLNPSNSRPAMSYYQMSTNSVFINQCTTALASCNSAGNWTQTAAQTGTAVGISTVTATTHEQMLNTSLTFSASGVPFIAYTTGISPSGMNPALALTDSATGFTPTLPVALASSGTTASLLGASPLSSAQYGMNVSAIRNAQGQFISVHIGPNNWLFATSCGD